MKYGQVIFIFVTSNTKLKCHVDQRSAVNVTTVKL